MGIQLRKAALEKATLGLGVAALVFTPTSAFAAVEAETAYIFNTLLFLIAGMVVMFMAAGFCMLETGMVRSKNAATISLKNIALYAVAGLMFWIVGYNLMYGIGEGGILGSFAPWSPDDPNIAAGEYASDGYASGSDWFFQMVFCATTASIVSGTLAERMKLWPFLIFTVVLTGIIYPIQGSWEWGGGWLDARFAFSDFAGSTLVHSVGGWAALMGALFLGARHGKYLPNGQVHPMPGSNLPLATLGTFILWLGWFGFNGGSQLAFGSGDNAAAVSNIFINTNIAAAAGVVAAMLATQILYKKVDLTMALNGALAGLVSITAEPLMPSLGQAALIGAVGGVLVVFAVPLLDKLKIDDVVGAIPVHLVCGIWGTMAVPISNHGKMADGDPTFLGQFIGVVAIGAFVCLASAIVWAALKYTVGIRVSAEEEMDGLDYSELGLEAYPEFVRT